MLLKYTVNYNLIATLIMNVKKIANITGAENTASGNKTEKNEQFKKLLEEFLNSEKAVNTKPLKSTDLEKLGNGSSYNVFSRIKVNHINNSGINSRLIDSILNRNEDSEADKLSEVKEKLKNGFYLKDDIIEETAGKILDDFDMGYIHE